MLLIFAGTACHKQMFRKLLFDVRKLWILRSLRSFRFLKLWLEARKLWKMVRKLCFLEVLAKYVKNEFQKQSSRGVLWKGYSQKFRKILRRAPVPESLKKETLVQMFSYEFCKFLRTPILQNLCEQVFLEFTS